MSSYFADNWLCEEYARSATLSNQTGTDLRQQTGYTQLSEIIPFQVKRTSIPGRLLGKVISRYLIDGDLCLTRERPWRYNISVSIIAPT